LSRIVKLQVLNRPNQAVK